MESTYLPLADCPGPAAAVAFDRIAQDYDQRFTDSLIGRAQREAVWKVLTRTFRTNDNILELNCGTGEDAIFLAGNGISVFALDASRQMIARAQQRLQHTAPRLPVVFCELPTERIGELRPEMQFDGAFSNFSGLNCISDLRAVASSLANLVKQDGRLVLCLSTRFCLIEILYYLALGQWRKALRRCKGYTKVTLDGVEFAVYYPTIRQIRQSFAPNFRLYSCTGIGVAVPPSYLETWARNHPRIFPLLRRLEELLATMPIFRSTGDNVLLCFEKVSR
ncbi:class I SAM-dependent methyltransferase [Edaphobacter modestus]|uniref:Ubiquinone/menaquinone biosynthesis C-methylase UbiE n=1 Tax=Edaphobacter modestus TaxID=388466 RepID=A0A4Q7Z0V4_9BACT|nr:class I SAM-dependent methyltransferase [Edaphobacter modestus]RZU43115.1 ubiquinone/menaquinone biosynthesis C-methylase UbiE [Edaphobacter modestus]